MFSLFSRGWKYMVAALTGKLDEISDPKVQIEQAIQEAQAQHQSLSQQAAAVIGNKHQLEAKVNRQQAEVDKLLGGARQALVMSEQASANGDEAKAIQYESTANTFAVQLTAAEETLASLQAMQADAEVAAQNAKDAVEANAMRLQNKMAEKTQLLSKLEQAKMQEKVTAAMSDMTMTADRNVPTLDSVRDKIEARHAKAKGGAELAANSVEGRMMEVQKAAMEAGGAARLDQIRASLGQSAPAPTQATPPVAAPQQNAPATENPAAS